MRAAAVLYVGDLARVRSFYEGCFDLSIADATPDYCGLQSETWLLTLVQSSEALPTATPAPRRTQTPIKLGIEVDSIAAIRAVAPGLGGRVDPSGGEWTFRNATHCDCVDPEGNVLQLIEPHLGGTTKVAGSPTRFDR